MASAFNRDQYAKSPAITGPTVTQNSTFLPKFLAVAKTTV